MSEHDELWEPGGDRDGAGDDELRRLESALARHRYRPRRWELPADAPAADATAGQPTEVQPASAAAPDAAATTPSPVDMRAAAASDPGAPSAANSSGELAPPAAAGSWWAAFARQGPRERRRLVLQLLAAAAVLLVLLGDVFDWRGPGGGDGAGLDGYELAAAEGDVRLEGAGAGLLRPGRALRAGEVLVVDEAASARVSLGPEGWFDLGARSRLRFEAAHEDDEAAWRLYLERGELSASIFAAPRLFQLGTPSGIAVDLGCIYTAQVGEDGATRLTVRGGQVSFETEQRKVFVPAGAVVVARPGAGPGTPTWEDGPPELAAAVARLDQAPGGWGAADEQALATVLSVEQPRDTLTLWHLLDHARPDVRRGVYGRLVALAPPPGSVTESGALAGDPAMLSAWRDELERHW